MWGNICRVCSSRADYEIFAKIPSYLHASTNEFLSWQKPINILLEETTGLKVSPDDGLPRLICRICISYLKHAVTFREQCVNNSLSLIAIATLKHDRIISCGDDKSKQKESVLITAQDLCFTERSMQNLLLNNSNKPEQQNKVHKQLLHQTAPYLNLHFDKVSYTGEHRKYCNSSVLPDSSSGGSVDSITGEEYSTPTISSDDNEDVCTGNADKNFYNYREKNFEEDDILDVDILRKAVTINIPESCKERKCRACCKRFMFDDTYINHLNVCPEYYFFVFIEKVNILLDIRKNKALSPHEYIRRMIFCIRKTCEWLRKNSIEEIHFDIGQQQEDKSCIKSKIKAEDASILRYNGKPNLKNINTFVSTNDKSTDKNVTGLSTHIRLGAPQMGGTTTPITKDNNILYEIERSASQSSKGKPITAVVMKPIAIRGKDFEKARIRSRSPSPLWNSSCASLIVNKTNEIDRLSFLKKIKDSVNPERTSLTNTLTTKKTPIFYYFNYSARCNPCNLFFESITELEIHNATFHNTKNINDINSIVSQSQ